MKFAFPFAAIAAVACVGSMTTIFPCASAEEAPEATGLDSRASAPHAERFLVLGDKAFQSGLYDQALSFFEEHRKTLPDSREPGDAYLEIQIRILECLLRLDRIEEARSLFGELKLRHPGIPTEKGTLIQANILLAEGQYSEARRMFRSLLGSENVPPEIRSSAIDGAGFASARLQDWPDAVNMYAKLAESGKNGTFDFRAARQTFLALLSQGKWEEAEKTAAAVPETLRTEKASQMELMNALLQLRKGNLKEATRIYEKIDKFGQVDARALLFQTACEIGQALLDAQDAQAAVPVLVDAVYAAPGKPDRKTAFMLLMKAHSLQDDLSSALSVARRYLEYYRDEDPQTFEITLNLARILFKMNRIGEALTTLLGIRENVSAPMEYRVEAAMEAAMILKQENRNTQAIENLRFVSENAASPERRAEAVYWIGSLLAAEKRYKEAISTFLSIDGTQPTWQEQGTWQAILAALNAGNFRQLGTLAAKFPADFPESEHVLDATYLEIVAFREIGERSEAIRRFLEFAEQFPESKLAPEAILNAGAILFDTGKFAESSALFELVSKRYPDSETAPQALYRGMYAIALESPNNPPFDKIFDQAKHLQQTFPESDFTVHALFWLAQTCVLHEKTEKADEILDTLFRNYPNRPTVVARAAFERAEIAFRRNEPEKAQSHLKEIIERFPDDPILSNALYLLGDIYSSTQNFEQAIMSYQKAASRRPGSDFETACIGRIGDCHFSLFPNDFDPKCLEKALEAYERVLKRSALTPMIRIQTLYKVGRCHQEIGNDEKAIEAFRRVLPESDLGNTAPGKPEATWVVRSAIALVNLYLKKNTPETAEQAIGVYRKLIESGFGPVEEFRDRVSAIRAEYRL